MPATTAGARVLPWVVFALLVAEGLQFTFYRQRLPGYWAPVMLYLTAVALCVATYLAVRQRPWAEVLPAARSWKHGVLPAALGLLTGLVLALPQLHKIILNTAAQDWSDIVPAITVYCQRLLDGEVVHQPLTEHIGYFLEPGYLPAMWVPFVVPEYFAFDYRWMSSAVLLAGMLAYGVVVVRLRRSAGVTFLLSALPPLLAYAILRTDNSIFSVALEPLVIGYYMLLVAGVLLRQWPLVVAALVLCLLSRFALVFWVPLYFGLVYVSESRRRAWQLAGFTALGIVLLYIVPVLSHDWGLFMRVQKVYTETTLGEWRHLDNGRPIHLFNGIGLTSLIYEFGPADILARIKLAKTVHLGLLLGIIAVAAIGYKLQREPRTNYRVYAIVVLKIYLTTFYAFLQVPYAYIASTGFFVSIYLLVLAVGPASAHSPDATGPVPSPVATPG